MAVDPVVLPMIWLLLAVAGGTLLVAGLVAVVLIATMRKRDDER